MLFDLIAGRPSAARLRIPGMSLLHVVAATLTICMALAGCRGASGVGENPAEKEAEDYLVRYIRIDTSNPPGNETAGAQFLQEILRKEGIDAQLVGSNPARQSVYARLASGSPEPALLLLHHIDVVPANPAHWSVPPFSAQRSGGYIWGRGALDVKSLGIANLMAVLDLKRTGAKLKRDVIFLGVGDEEGGGKHGCEDLLANRSELFTNVGFVLNEGGGNETIVDKVSFWGIEVDQKVPLWLRVVSRGEAGHGAVPPDSGGTTVQLLEALAEVQKIERPYRLTPSVDRYFDALALKKPGSKGEILRDPTDYFDSPSLKQLSPAYRALLQDTLAVTRLSAGDLVNSIPPEATADLDLRLLPDSDPGAMLERIRAATGRRGSVSVILQGRAAPPSPVDTDLYRTLERVMKRAEPTSVVGPSVSAGTSDSRFFRARNVVAYGISPFKVNYYDANTVHGVDERIRARFFVQGVTLMRQIVRDFCVQRDR
jgi:acetylornithine deacetylase/succinyl-diaminopimelate desuccinylase-like protein